MSGESKVVQLKRRLSIKGKMQDGVQGGRNTKAPRFIIVGGGKTNM